MIKWFLDIGAKLNSLGNRLMPVSIMAILILLVLYLVQKHFGRFGRF